VDACQLDEVRASAKRIDKATEYAEYVTACIQAAPHIVDLLTALDAKRMSLGCAGPLRRVRRHPLTTTDSIADSALPRLRCGHARRQL
jgi:hypothetical protein